MNGSRFFGVTVVEKGEICSWRWLARAVAGQTVSGRFWQGFGLSFSGGSFSFWHLLESCGPCTVYELKLFLVGLTLTVLSIRVCERVWWFIYKVSVERVGIVEFQDRRKIKFKELSLSKYILFIDPIPLETQVST